MLPEMIVDAVRSTISQGIEAHFADHMERHRATRWLVFSDYVLRQPNRPNDVFAFTLMPGGKELESLIAEFPVIATRDFKDVRTVSESMLTLLCDERLFTICFIANPSRRITRNVATLRGMLDQTIAMMERWQDANCHAEMIGKFKAMRNKAESEGFNVRLLDDILVATSLAALLVVLICKQARAERIGWFSDRDSITTAHQSIANYFYGVNVSAFCQRLMDGWRGPELGINGSVEEGGSLWCDSFLRIPDYCAGAISAWSIDQNKLPSEPQKYLQVLSEGIAGQSNIHLIRLNFEWQNERLEVSSSRVLVSRSPGEQGEL